MSRRRFPALAVVPLVAQVLLARPGVARAGPVPAIPPDELPPLPSLQEGAPVTTDFEAVLAREEVVSGSARREQSLGEVASAVTVIPGDQLRRFGYRTVAEALQAVVGVNVVDDRMLPRVGVRGVQLLGDANTRVLVLLDGSPMNEPWGQYVDIAGALPVSIDDIERIEVIRGPISAVYGTNAFLGTINIVTLGADQSGKAYARVSAGTINTAAANLGFGLGTQRKQLRGRAAGTYRIGEKIEYPAFGLAGGESQVDADFQQGYLVSLSGNYEQFFVHARASQRRRLLPGAPYEATIGSRDTQHLDQSYLGELGAVQPLSRSVTLVGRVYGNEYHFKGDYDYSPSPSFSTQARAFWWGADARVVASLLRREALTLTGGLTADWVRTSTDAVLRDESSSPIAGSNRFDTQALYAEATVRPWSWLSGSAGIRFDRNSIFQSKVSTRGALMLQRSNDVGLKLLYAEGFRNPSVFEAYYADGTRYRPSGGALFPETIRSLEAMAWAVPWAGLRLRASAWVWDLNGMIEKRRVYDPEALAVRLQFQNLASLSSKGVEVEVRYRDVRGWTGYAGASLSSVLRNEVEPALNSPGLMVQAGISSRRFAELVHLSTELAYLGPRTTRALRPTSAFLQWNAAVYFPNVRQFDLTLGARNLLGLRQEVPLQSDYDRNLQQVAIGPGEGRELFLRLGYRL